METLHPIKLFYQEMYTFQGFQETPETTEEEITSALKGMTNNRDLAMTNY